MEGSAQQATESLGGVYQFADVRWIWTASSCSAQEYPST